MAFKLKYTSDDSWNDNATDQFALKRSLQAEARERLMTLPEASERPDPTSGDAPMVFVTEWLHDADGALVGVGCDRTLRTVRMTVRSVRPGVFVVSNNPLTLRATCSIHGYEITVYENLQFRCNNFQLHDLFVDPDLLTRSAMLVKITTNTFDEADRMHRVLRNDSRTYRYACVTHYWDANKQILFETMVRRNASATSLEVPVIIHRWFDAYLRNYDCPAPRLPIITFDIETVSTDPQRVPTGEDANDILFTVSVHHTVESDNDDELSGQLYTLVYLPIHRHPESLPPPPPLTTMDYERVEFVGNTRSAVDNRRSLAESLRRRMLAMDEYPGYGAIENTVEVFVREIDLLRRTIELLRPQRPDTLHYLVGYNSLNYDIKYLLMRCAFYRLHVNEFVWKEGYALGFQQMHVDMFRVARMRYSLNKYTLSNVSRTILKDDKADVDAVALRFTFMRMLKYQTLYTHEQYEELTNSNNIVYPSLRDAIHYNNQDTLLVSRLVMVTGAIQFLRDHATACRMSVSSMNTNFDKIQQRILNQCLVKGLSRGIFLTTFKQSDRANVVLPYAPSDRANFLELTLDIESELTTVDESDPSRRKKYTGGANFCLGEFDVDQVQEYDYRVAYPLLIDRKNLSDETCTVLPADIVMHMLFPETRYKKFDGTHRTAHEIVARWVVDEDLVAYDYMSHSGVSKTETKILYYQYLYSGRYFGGRVPLTRDELYKRGKSLVILVLTERKRRGVLSEILASFNGDREIIKCKRKILQSVIDQINSLSDKYIEMELTIQNQTENEEATAFEDGEDAFTTEDDDPLAFDISHNDKDDEDPFAAAFDTTHNNKDDEDSFAFDTNDNDYYDDEDPFAAAFTITDSVDDDDAVSVEVTDHDADDMSFKCTNEYIRIHNGVCTLNERLLNECARPLDQLKRLRAAVALECEEYENQDRLLKTQISSIYGCVGKLKFTLAAIVTHFIRLYLISSAECMIHEYKCRVYYCDTDSIYAYNPNGTDLSSVLNSKYPYTDLELKKTHDKVMIVRKKRCYYKFEGNLRYGQHVNGPPAWRWMVQFFYSKSSDTRTIEDVYRLLVNFFIRAYDMVIKDIAARGRDAFDLEKSIIGQQIKIKSKYHTLTPSEELRRYLIARHPALAGSFRQTVFYHFTESDVLKITLKPMVELQAKYDECRANDSPMAETLRSVNFFKFYQNMCKTVYHVTSFSVKRNNAPYVVTLDESNFRLLMLKAFMLVYGYVYGDDGDGYDENMIKLRSGNAEESHLSACVRLALIRDARVERRLDAKEQDRILIDFDDEGPSGEDDDDDVV